MSIFQLFLKMFLLLVMLPVSCSITDHTIQTKTKNPIEKINTGEIEKVKETKAEVFSDNIGELTTKDITRGRDINSYSQGGHFGAKEDSPKNEREVRDFIWQCWVNKKRGYIRVTYVSLEGYASTSHIFIEPNEQGNWRVVWRIVRQEDLIHDIPELVSVERMEDKPEKGEWALVFKNKSGEIMQRFPDFYQ